MELIRGRRTVLRVYVHSTPYSVPVITELRAWRGQTRIPTWVYGNGRIPFQTLTTTVYSDPAHRLNHWHAAWIDLPLDWTGYGGAEPATQFDLTIYSGETTSKHIILLGYPVTIYQHGDPTQPAYEYSVFSPSFQSMMHGALRYHPISYQNSTWIDPAERGHYAASYDLRTPQGRDALLKGLAWDRAWNMYGGRHRSMPNNHYVGLVHPMVDTQSPQGQVLGLAATPGKVAWIKMTGLRHLWHDQGAWLLAHELAHNYGLLHFPCLQSETPGVPAEGQADWTWPASYRYPNCSLASADITGYYGLDTHFRAYGYTEPWVLSNDPTSPQAAFPLMGYRPPNWIAPAEYCRIMLAQGLECSSANLLEVGREANSDVANSRFTEAYRSLTSTEEHWLVSGWFDPDTAEGQIDQMRAFDDVDPSALEQVARELANREGSELRTDALYSLAQVDGRGQVLHQRDLSSVATEGVPGGSFVEALPKQPGVSAVQLLVDGRILDERTASSGAPWVTIQEPIAGQLVQPGTKIRWSAGDDDGDDLEFDVCYSSDGGDSWQLLASGLSEEQWAFPAGDLVPGSSHGRLRVVASDGFNCATAETDGEFSVPFKRPLAWITSPAAEQEIPPGQDLLLTGTGFDPEDGNLVDGQLEWSMDGVVVGHGEQVSLSDVVPGSYWLELQASDSSGDTTRDGRLIHYGPYRIPLPAISKLHSSTQ